MVLEMEMSKTYQYRKVMKPMLERKRRARINKCLDNLKDLVVECMTQEGEHVTRLEKADILELTVEHMKKLKNQGSLILNSKFESTTAVSFSSKDCFHSGYVHAADQISKVLAATPGVDVDLGTKLMTFLGQRLNEIKTWATTTRKMVDRSLISPPDNKISSSGLYTETPLSPIIDFSGHNYSQITGFSDFKTDYHNFVQTKFEEVSNLSKETVWRPW